MRTRTYTGRSNPVAVTKPDDTRTLDTAMPIGDPNSLGASSGIKKTQLLVTARLYYVSVVSSAPLVDYIPWQVESQ